MNDLVDNTVCCTCIRGVADKLAEVREVLNTSDDDTVEPCLKTTWVRRPPCY